jgi:hypothetical protein
MKTTCELINELSVQLSASLVKKPFDPEASRLIVRQISQIVENAVVEDADATRAAYRHGCTTCTCQH